MENLSKKRVIDALEGRVPDKVPFMFAAFSSKVQEQILGRKVVSPFGIPYGHVPEGKLGEKPVFLGYDPYDVEVARRLKLDALGCKFLPPLFANYVYSDDGCATIVSGKIATPEDLAQVTWPDADDERIYEPFRKFCEAYGNEFAIYANIRMGISVTLNSMGLDNFSYAIYDEPEMVKEFVGRYQEFIRKVIPNLISAGADFLWSFEDMAYKEAPMFSRDVFREFFLPEMKKTTEQISVPWIFHSDGNLFPILDDLMELGMNGLHPLEPGAMDLALLKEKYGKKLTLVGNLDIDYTLTKASREEIFATVKDKIDVMGPGGRYIISDSNSVPFYANPENVMIAAEAVEQYRNIY